MRSVSGCSYLALALNDREIDDYFAGVEVNRLADAQEMDKLLRTAGFQMDDAQRNYLNASGLEQSKIDDYFRTKEMNAALETLDFNQLMTASGFITEEDQRLFMNQQGLDDRAVEDYFNGMLLVLY